MRLGVVMTRHAPRSKAAVRAAATTRRKSLTAMFRMRRDVEKQCDTPTPPRCVEGKIAEGWAAMILSRSPPETIPLGQRLINIPPPTGYDRAKLRHRQPGTRLPRRADPQAYRTGVRR